jgi:hypothetical protein
MIQYRAGGDRRRPVWLKDRLSEFFDLAENDRKWPFGEVRERPVLSRTNGGNGSGKVSGADLTMSRSGG